MSTTTGARTRVRTRTGVAAAGGAMAIAALGLSLCLVGVAAGSPAAADTVPPTPPATTDTGVPVPTTSAPPTPPPTTPAPSTSAPTTAPPTSPSPSTASPTPTTPTTTPTPTPTKPSPSPTKPTPTPTPTPTKPKPKPPVVQTTLRLPMAYGVRGPYVALLQQRLAWLGYPISRTELGQRFFGASTRTAVSRFQTKFFLSRTGVASKGTWAAVAAKAGRVGALPAACRGGGVTLCIDKNAKLLRYVRGGTVVLTLDARFGMESTPTRNGSFRVYRKSRDHVSSLYRTWMPYAMFFSGGQAVHYSPYFARDGYAGASHGCVNIRDMGGVRWIFDHAPIGTRVYIYRS